MRETSPVTMPTVFMTMRFGRDRAVLPLGMRPPPDPGPRRAAAAMAYPSRTMASAARTAHTRRDIPPAPAAARSSEHEA